jgi:hypothetical protein
VTALAILPGSAIAAAVGVAWLYLANGRASRRRARLQ